MMHRTTIVSAITCALTAQLGAQEVFWSAGPDLKRWTPEDGERSLLNPNEIWEIEIDPVSGRLFWINDDRQLISARPDGTDQQALGIADGIAIDNRQLYINQLDPPRFLVANLDGSDQRVLADLPHGAQLGVDANAGFAFAVARGRDMLRIRLDDGSIETIPTPVQSVNIVVDPVDQRVYANGTPFPTNGLVSFTYDGTDPQVHAPNTGVGSQIIIDPVSRHILWYSNGMIRYDIGTGTVEPIGEFHPIGLAIEPGTPTIYWSDRVAGGLVTTNLDTDVTTPILTNRLQASAGIVADPRTGTLFAADRATDQILRVSTDGSGLRPVVTAGVDTPSELAFDATRNRLYWAEPDEIRYATPTPGGTTSWTTIVRDRPAPLTGQIGVDPTTGALWWSEGDAENATIYEIDPDGTNARVAIPTSARVFAFEGQEAVWVGPTGLERLTRPTFTPSDLLPKSTTGDPLDAAVDATGAVVHLATFDINVYRSSTDGTSDVIGTRPISFGDRPAQLAVLDRACACDLDNDGAIDPADLLSYLTGWFIASPVAERTGDVPADISIRDLLDLLDCWFDAQTGACT